MLRYSVQPRISTYLAILLLSLFSFGASAHEPKEFTVILSEESAIPSSIGTGVLVETDSLFFINVDEREGYSHRIQIDADGDGEYNGGDDFSTGWLQASCDLDENDSKVEPDCMVTSLVFLGPQNGLLPGNVSMMHQIRIGDETSQVPFYANFGPDEHVPLTTENTPLGGNDENDDSNQDTLVLLLVISIFGIIITAPKLLQSEQRDGP